VNSNPRDAKNQRPHCILHIMTGPFRSQSAKKPVVSPIRTPSRLAKNRQNTVASASGLGAYSVFAT